jgi:UDP-N-acetylmuramoyl-L-alanyl-D-glutamate--2,6-diaminopimelate ligase
MVIIDYAHSPDGLRRVLVDAREFSGLGRLIIVFGACGERDIEKRPGMGAATGENADVVIVTSESPRFEDPESIIDDIVKGIPAGARWHREIDRRAAIALALRIAEPNDTVIVAGKGHENVRYIQGEVIPFNDRSVVTELLQTRI